jgi:transcriptional regulator with AAA-type ATPase domain
MDYEEEFSETFDRIERYLNEYKVQGNRNLERDIEKNIELASKLSSRMEAETLEMDVKRRAEKFQQKVKKSKLEFERIKNQLNKDSLMMDKNYKESDSLLTDSRTKNLGTFSVSSEFRQHEESGRHFKFYF